MTTLNDILDMHNHEKYAVDNGTRIHALLQHVVIDKNTEQGDTVLVEKIKSKPDIMRFFCSESKTEVPVAGVLNNQFVSRRIDRLCIDNTKKHIDVIDYKTDVNHDVFYTKYIYQIREYVNLLAMIYPDYKINAYILWTHDFLLEKIV
jgi:ATP-dependent exoDNAse (exonuclease V) beta subunit